MSVETEEKNYVIGFDIGEQSAQISFVTYEGDEGDVYNIPICLCKRTGANQWFHGEEAVQYAAEGKGTLITSLVPCAYYGKRIMVENRELDACALMVLFVRICMTKAGFLRKNATIKSIVFSVDRMDEAAFKALSMIKKEIFPKLDTLFLQTRRESLFYYTIHQPKELWGYEVCVVDLSDGFLKTYSVRMNRRSRPILTTIEDEEYRDIRVPQEKNPHSQEQALARLDTQIEGLMKEKLEGKIVTSVYLIGTVFEKDWYPESKKLLCKNRRVFGGSNLYSKGACLGGMEKILPGENDKAYIYLGKEKCAYNIAVPVMQNGRACERVMISGGTNWFEAKAEFTFMPDADFHLPILLHSLDGKEHRTVPVVLPKIAGRDEKNTRYRCQLSMKSARELVVHIADDGFGELFKTTGKEYEEIIALEEIR